MAAIKNIAIIAHVDHGKTTLVDKIMYHCRLFRENEFTKDIAVVLMQTKIYGLENNNEDGQCAILLKPFTPYELIQNIRSV